MHRRGCGAESVGQSLSMWLTGTIDTVSVDSNCAASLSRVARLGQARLGQAGPGQAGSPSGSHLSSTAAAHVTGEKNFSWAWCHRFSCNGSWTVSLALWYSGPPGPLPTYPPPRSHSLSGSSLCASIRGVESVIFISFVSWDIVEVGFDCSHVFTQQWPEDTAVFYCCFCFVDFCFD